MSEERKEPFRLLTTDELSRLTQQERLEYIDRTITALKARGENFHLFDESNLEPGQKKDK